METQSNNSSSENSANSTTPKINNHVISKGTESLRQDGSSIPPAKSKRNIHNPNRTLVEELAKEKKVGSKGQLTTLEVICHDFIENQGKESSRVKQLMEQLESVSQQNILLNGELTQLKERILKLEEENKKLLQQREQEQLELSNKESKKVN